MQKDEKGEEEVHVWSVAGFLGSVGMWGGAQRGGLAISSSFNFNFTHTVQEFEMRLDEVIHSC